MNRLDICQNTKKNLSFVIFDDWKKPQAMADYCLNELQVDRFLFGKSNPFFTLAEQEKAVEYFAAMPAEKRLDFLALAQKQLNNEISFESFCEAAEKLKNN